MTDKTQPESTKQGKPDRKLNAAERQRMALELRKSGVAYDQIASRLGYKDASGAHRAVTRGLAKSIREASDDLRKIELERLDALLFGLWTSAKAGNQGAIDRVLRIMERRAKLLGLDAPTKVAPTTPDGERPYEELTDDERAARIAQILETARARGAGQTAEGKKEGDSSSVTETSA